MSEQQASNANDDTLIRPVGAFYNGRPPAAPGASTAPGGSGDSGDSGPPTLAERIMHRLPPPPDKAKEQAAYEQRQREAERERAHELDELHKADAAREAARQAARQPAPVSQPTPVRNPVTTQQAAPAAAATAVRSGVAAAPPHDPVPAIAARSAATPAPAQVATRAARRTRKARLRIARIDPWSVMKTFFLFSIASGIAFVTFVALLYMLVEGSGIFATVNEMVQVVFGQQNDDTPFDITAIAGWDRVMGITALLACVNVVILTALATLGSFLYNLSATMLGGLELTLAED